MKKLSLIVLLLIATTLCFAQNYYVSPTGNDAANGSQATPWKTVRNAVLTVTSPGSTINILPGTYTESSSTINLAVGVNLKGADPATTIIKTTMSGQWSTFLNLESNTLTNGNQTISGITFDGSYVSETNYKTWFGIWITLRNNVVFDNCVIQNFYQRGVIMNGNGHNEEPKDPGVYATGFKFINCKMLNCGGNDGNTYGQLNIGGTKDALIQNNYMDQTQRPNTKNGECIKYWGSGYNLGLKILNNTLKRANHYSTQYNGSNGDWNFVVELFNNTGLEIGNNILQGSLDINYNRPGNGYAKSFWIHDNISDHNPINNKEEQGIVIEFEANEFLIENNKFLNQSTGITFNVRPPGTTGGYNNPKPVGGYSAITNGVIRNNLFTLYNLGNGLCCSRQGIQWYVEGETKTAYGRNIEISNNTFVNTTLPQNYCLDFSYFGVQSGGTPALSGVTIKNNIFLGFTSSYIASGSSWSNVSATNNCVWNCGNNNNSGWTGIVESNLKVNPALDANYLVQQNSPLYGLGIGYQATTISQSPCTFTYGQWICNGTTETRTYTASPLGCIGTPPTDSITRQCSVSINQPPIANAGQDKSITLPVNTVTLAGTGTDTDGTVVAYQWKNSSGSVIANTANVTLTNLVAGTYSYTLTVTDNQGATGTDAVIVTVNAAPVFYDTVYCKTIWYGTNLTKRAVTYIVKKADGYYDNTGVKRAVRIYQIANNSCFYKASDGLFYNLPQ